MKKILYSFIITLFFTLNLSANTNNEELYKKIDLFAEVLDKIKKEYVDKVDQSELIDDAINGDVIIALSGGVGVIAGILIAVAFNQMSKRHAY